MLHKIKELCKEQGLTLTELETLAGLTPRSIFKWEATMPAADKLARVARVLHTTVEELLADPEEQTPDAV